MNVVSLIGRLTKDPEVRYSTGANAMAIAKFSIAIDDGYGENKRTNYPNITCFGKTAEIVEKWLTKGSQVAIVGKLQTGSYEKDGKKVYTTEVIADRLEFVGSKTNKGHAENEAGDLAGFTPMEDDIPF